jgi:hypothetical protein
LAATSINIESTKYAVVYCGREAVAYLWSTGLLVHLRVLSLGHWIAHVLEQFLTCDEVYIVVIVHDFLNPSFEHAPIALEPASMKKYPHWRSVSVVATFEVAIQHS